MEIYVIGDEQTVLGLRLVGIEGWIASTRDAAAVALRELLQREHAGLVLITESLATLIREDVDRQVYGVGFPLVVEIPGPAGPAADRASIAAILRKAIGVSV